jgi:L-idonate 5-dehydrogenase
MRGVVIHAPKDLRIEEVEAVPPGPHEVRVRIEAGGICGSDLHYFHHGGFGTIRLQQPMALGHEIAGTVAEVGSQVSHLIAGMRVAVNPSQPCGACSASTCASWGARCGFLMSRVGFGRASQSRPIR